MRKIAEEKLQYPFFVMRVKAAFPNYNEYALAILIVETIRLARAHYNIWLRLSNADPKLTSQSASEKADRLRDRIRAMWEKAGLNARFVFASDPRGLCACIWLPNDVSQGTAIPT